MKNNYEKKKILTAWAKIAASNPEFGECVEEIESDCRALLDMDLGNTANEGILNIAGNVITMTVIYNTVLKFLQEV